VTIEEGTNELLGLDPERLTEIPSLLATPREPRMPPLWDGHAGERAAQAIASFVSASR
jgi:UDP-N-acetylglucosamine 2-epimerase (non-hydrolysing)